MTRILQPDQWSKLLWLPRSTLPQAITQTTCSDVALLALSLIGLTSYCTQGKLWNRSDPLSYKYYERPQLLASTDPQQVDVSPDSNDIAAHLERSHKDGVIFWASQSGRAEGLACRLEKELDQRFGLQMLVSDISDFDHNSLKLVSSPRFAIFIMSTYGEGDPPDNGWSFWDWIKTTRTEHSLQALRYAAFGLGNSNYRHYNKVIDVVADSLGRQGATALLPTGKADDAKGETEEDFLQWRDDMCQALRHTYGLEERRTRYTPMFSIVERPELDASKLRPDAASAITRSTRHASKVIRAKITTMRVETMPLADKQSMHFEFDLTEHPQLKYKTGDHLMLWPVNPPQEVNRLVQVLGLTQTTDTPITVSAVNLSHKSASFPTPTTLTSLFQHHLEICAPVSRGTFLTVSELVNSNLISTVFSQIASNKETFAAFTASRHLTFARMLEYAKELDSGVDLSVLPLSFVLESLKPMSARYYSISSSSTVSPRRASITVSTSTTVLPTAPAVTIPGLASSFLSGHICKDDTSQLLTPSVAIQLRRSDFKLPSSSTTPLILIAAGSGIAPIRAFLHERARLSKIGRASGSILFFYGCRHPEQDYLYHDEIKEFAAITLKGELQIFPAFSRYAKKKCYVQDRVDEQRDLVAKLMVDDTASLYICGSTVMAKAAGDRVVEAVRAYSGLEEQEGMEWRAEMKRFRRWQEDVWG